MSAKTINEVIRILEDIIQESIRENNPLGYFACLYQKVTIKVKEGILNNEFEDGPRMEKLDVIFANRYIDAWFDYKENKPVTESWKCSFEFGNQYWPIVLQHLLIGMNAHINLDLGIAAAEISKGKDIQALEKDFNKINEVLSSLVNEVQNDLANIWPLLRKILRYTKKVDNFMVDFSMEIARDGAWKFAQDLAAKPDHQWKATIQERDEKVFKNAKLIIRPGIIPKIALGIIRFRERGSIAHKIKELR